MGFLGLGKKPKQHTPKEAKDSGRSKQLVRVVEVISEGEIQGLVDNERSIFLDNTPLVSRDGTDNFKNVFYDGREGTQDQSLMQGFDYTEKEVNVGTEVRKHTPLTRTITDSKVNRLRLTLGVSALFQQADNGDTNGARIDFKITVGSQTYTLTIDGKYSSQYLRNIVIDSLPAVPFTVKVERVQNDSTSQRLQNKTLWASYTEIIDTAFAYPNTALVGIKFDSEYFSNIPTRSYDIFGIKLRVPSNYDPATRRYSGLWDGTFKIAYSNNPAWVLMDIVTNKRYGLGQRLGEFWVDKWALYQVAQYCDQMIPNGYGGTEPRFTCNVWMTEQRSAYEVINDICSIFRAMPVWNGTELTVIMDRPSDPVWTYTNANVINGEFSRQYSAIKARHNAIQVEYQDATNNYEKAIEYISNDEDIRKYGLNLKKVSAFGCTSRGQAYRTGRWILETERLETETITFSVGSEGLMHIPGDIIKVADNHYAGTDIGGRVIAVSGNTVTLDRDITISGNSYLSYINTNAKQSNIRIHRVKGNVVTLDSPPTGLAEMGVWSLTTQQITARLYRAMSISENDDGSYTITALQHEPQKEAIVDNGAVFEPVAATAHKTPKIEHLDIDLSHGSAKFGWQTTSGTGTLTYDIRILKAGKLYALHKGVTSSDFALDDLPDGDYSVIIQAKNASGQLINEVSKTFVIARPPLPKNIQIVGGLSDISLSWDYVDDITQTEIWASDRNDVRTAKRVAKVLASFYSHAVGARQTRYYWLRHTRGQNVGAFSQQQGISATSGADIDAELRLLNEKLSEPIINNVFDVAAPARGLELIKTVDNLENPNKFIGYTLVKNKADNRLYRWTGTEYSYATPASEISGVIQPQQLAKIPTSQISGQLTNAQIASIDAAKLTGTVAISKLPAVPTTKLSGTITAEQIATNAIGANHLRAQAVTANAIATGAIVAGKLAAEAVTATNLASSSVTAAKLAANSVAANHLQANSVVAGKIATNAVEAANIAANVIRAQHIASGEISADRLAIGLGGNLLQNPIFANNAYGWTTSNGTYTGGTINRIYGGQSNTDWNLKNPFSSEERMIKMIFVETITTAKNQWADVCRQKIRLIPNQWYIFSAYVNSYRCGAFLLVEELNASGGYVRAVASQRITNAGSFIHGVNQSSRNFIKFQCPASGYVEVMVRADNQTASNPDVYVARPMLEECTQHATAPSAWVNAGVTSIHGGSIVTRTITADRLLANTITANEIASNAIATRHLSANSVNAGHVISRSLTADKLNINSLSAISANLGAVTAGSIRGVTITGNTISGTTITGGTITGARLEGATGKFTGELEVTQLIGGNIIAHITAQFTRERTVSANPYSNPIGNSFYTLLEATINFSPTPTARYVEIMNVYKLDPFIIPANTSRSVNVKRYISQEVSIKITEEMRTFFIKSYAVSTSVNSISIH